MASQIGLGLAALGRPGYINLGHADDLERNYAINAMRKRAHGVLDAAWNSGVRYFDVARSYGRAEEFLGTWLRERKINPNEIKVGSKWGYTYTAAWKVETPEGVAHEVKRHEHDVLKSQFNATFNQLGSYLSLYQIHSATLESQVLDNKEVLATLLKLRQTGMQIGLSVSGENQAATIQKAMSIVFDDIPLFQSIQATWNLLERSAEDALAAANNKGLEIIVKESLANGRLTTRNECPQFAGKLKELKGIASELNTTIDALAIAAALAQPWANCVLSGAATTKQLESNLAAENLNLPTEVIQQLLALRELPNEYWSKRSSLDWN